MRYAEGGRIKTVRLSATRIPKDTPIRPLPATDGNPDFVLSLARGLQVIEAFDRTTEDLSVGDLAAKTRLSRAAVRRLLITLEMLGYANRSGSRYRLSTRLLRLGFSSLSADSLLALGYPVIQHVTQVLHESSSLGTLQGDMVVYIARSATERVMSISLAVGSRLPAYCTSMGRVLLGAMPEHELASSLKRMEIKRLTPKTTVNRRMLLQAIERTRVTGYSVIDEELEIGLRSIAVPVKSRAGKVVAAMNSGVNGARISKEDLIKRFLPVLQEQANLLGSMLE